MSAFGRTVLVVVATVFCLPSAHVYAQSNTSQEIQQLEATEDTSEPPRPSAVDNLEPSSVEPALEPTPVPEPLSVPPTSLDELSPGYRSQSILPITGKVMFYNPGIMEIVIDNRRKANDIGRCDDCIGFAALLRAGDLDRKIWIQFESGLVEGPFHVVDVAAPQHVLMLIGKEWVADVDYETAMRWRMAGPRWGTVLSEPPAGYMSPLELLRYDLLAPSDLSAPGVYHNEKLSQSYLMANDFDEVNELLVR